MAKRKAVRSEVRADGILSPEELQKAIAEYKARRAATTTQADEDEKAKAEVLAEQEIVKPQEEVEPTPVVPTEEEPIEPVKKDAEPEIEENENVPAPVDEPIELPDQTKPVDEKIKAVKSRRDLRDEKGDPEDMNGAMEQIAEQDEDIDYLYDLIDTLLAEREFNKGATQTDSEDDVIPNTETSEIGDEGKQDKQDCVGPKIDSADEVIPDVTKEEINEDEDDDFGDEDDDFEDEDDEMGIPATEEEPELVEDEDEEEEEDYNRPPFNTDSVDSIVQKQLRIRLNLAKIGSRLNMDGLEYLSIPNAKKRIIRKVRPNIHLDGKSDAFINALYNLCVDDVMKATKKDTRYQKNQMFGKKPFNSDSADDRYEDSADSRRNKMIERQVNRKPEKMAENKKK